MVVLSRFFSSIFLLLSCITTAHAADFNHGTWNELLKQHVIVLRNGQATQVDYAALSTERNRFKTYLNELSAIDKKTFDAWPKTQQLAFLINAYNAWTVELILTAYPNVKSIKDLGSLVQSPWKKRFITLLGGTRSLDEIEHELIRGSGRYNDPRIHFAVNCASVGCPALRSEAFVGDRLNAQLEDSVKNFLTDKTRNRIEANSLKVSSIFKWYREDFEKGWQGAKTLNSFFALYSSSLGLTSQQLSKLNTGELSIEFQDYDWALNSVSPTQTKPQ